MHTKSARKRIAIVGAGIAGLAAAHVLHPHHDITLYEAADSVGGHTHTVDVDDPQGRVAIDMGFIVFNEQNYPAFSKLLQSLDVASQPSDMSFSVSCAKTGIEYCGSTLKRTLFAQRRNLLRPSFHGMLRDVVRFNRLARRAALHAPASQTVSAFLEAHSFGTRFTDLYLLPMGAALWSTHRERVRDIPIRFLASFFMNHGFLETRDRPAWRVVKGGSRSYIPALTKPFRRDIRLLQRVVGIERQIQGVAVHLREQSPVHYDELIIATHGDQALRLLRDPTKSEQDVLGAVSYSHNEVVLHTDASLMPRCRRAWASWNYHNPVDAEETATVTYYMNRLQSLACDRKYFVTLNRTDDIRSSTVVTSRRFRHPTYTVSAADAQARWKEVSGVDRTWYAGAYWGYGFHEDGVRSALRIARALGIESSYA